MATKIADYDAAITGQSKQELLNLAKWLQNEKRNAFLVGGWAVYYHTRDGQRHPALYDEAIYGESEYDDAFGFAPLGSKDIDLVFPNAKERDSFEYNYCRKCCYKKQGDYGGKQWTKATTGKKPTEIIADLDVLSRNWQVRGNSVSWKPLLTHHVQLSLENGASIPAPAKELLLLYKCVAIVERTDSRQLPNQNISYLDSKIWKDANDVLALHGAGINENKLNALATETSLEKILLQAKQIIGSNYESYQFGQYASSRQFLSTQ